MRPDRPRVLHSPQRLHLLLVAGLMVLLLMAAAACGDSDTAETSATTAQAPETTAEAPSTTVNATDATMQEMDATAGVEEPESGGWATGAADLSDTIVLPEGWAMEDALAPADVEAVVGRSGLQYWMEPDSSASSGRPAGSFYDGENIDTKIRFRVFAQEGSAEYEHRVGFVENVEEVAADLWDKLVVGDATDANYALNRTVVLRGDVCMVIEWRPEYYGEFDRLDLGCRLADLLIGKLYKEE